MIRRVATALLTALILGAAAAWLLAVSEAFSARRKPSRIESLLATRLRNIAIPTVAKNRTNPLRESAPAEAKDDFIDHCAICHAADGRGATPMNRGLSPPAPGLGSRRTQGLADGEIFYVIRNGVRFTGMPAWDMDDDRIWRLVLYIRTLAQR